MALHQPLLEQRKHEASLIGRFLLTSYLQNRTAAQDLAAPGAVDFRALPLREHGRSTIRLDDLTRRLLPPRNAEYLRRRMPRWLARACPSLPGPWRGLSKLG